MLSSSCRKWFQCLRNPFMSIYLQIGHRFLLPHGPSSLTLAMPIGLLHLRHTRGRGTNTPRRFAPDGDRASRKNERIGIDETKRMIPHFRVLGQPVTSEVRSMTSEVKCWHANMQSCKHHANMSYCTSFEPARHCESFGA